MRLVRASAQGFLASSQQPIGCNLLKIGMIWFASRGERGAYIMNNARQLIVRTPSLLNRIPFPLVGDGRSAVRRTSLRRGQGLMSRTDAFDKSPDDTLPEPAVTDAEITASERPVSLATALLSEGAPPLPRTGAVALMTAVLEEAIRSCFSSTPQIRADAEAWITSGQRRSIFSYLSVCETLGLDADATRRAIKRLVAMGSNRKSVRRTRMNVRHSLLSSRRRKHARASH